MSTYAHILKELRAKEDENILKLYKQTYRKQEQRRVGEKYPQTLLN